jgi:hypothetical protein
MSIQFKVYAFVIMLVIPSFGFTAVRASKVVSVTATTPTPTSASAPHSTPSPITELGVMGFQSWRASRIEEARFNLDRMSSKVLADKIDGSKGQKTTRPDHRLDQARLNVEIAQELTIHDYFQLYLNQFKGKDALLEAAKKLSPEDVAELLSLYKKSLGADSSPPPSEKLERL